MAERAILECGDCRVSLPMLRGNDGTVAVDVSALYKDSRIVTYDPGFMSTAACRSGITFIDGDEGILRYRGHDIANLIGTEAGFCGVAYLLLRGALPSIQELTDFNAAVTTEYQIPEQVVATIRSFANSGHPMAMLIASFASLSAYYHGTGVDPLESAVLAIAKVPGIVAMIYRHTRGMDFVSVDAGLGYVQNFVKMMFGEMEKSRYDIVCQALDAIFIMHADHEQNASTSTVRMSGSAGAGLFACLSAGAATLWGPAHGGANEAVVKMLDEIGSPENVGKFIEGIKSGKSGGVRLMGFGHRVYKNYDPRARIIRDICKDVLRELGSSDELLKVALALEKAALEDEYFITRKLYPNVDFYSGIVLRAIEVPVNMFTAFFALARTTGWAAHWCEMVLDKGGVKICRPRQIYVGAQ